MRNKLILILLLILTFPSFSSLLRHGYFPMHDDMQAMRLFQMDKCIADSQIPCRWVPDMGYGYGYPQFNYYSPLPYYFMEGFHLLGFSYLNSVKAFFVLSLIVSAIGMYLLGNLLWGSIGGILSALFYTYLPIRAVDMYVRGAVGELAALSVLPFIFLFTHKVIKNEKKAVLGFALASSTLFMSHNITTIMIAPFLLIWIGYFSLKDAKKTTLVKLAKKFSLGFIWGLGIASFFLLPAWFERNLVHIESLTAGYFNYISHFVGVKTLLFGSYWGYGFSQAGAFDEINLSVGTIHLLFALLGLLGLWFSKKKEEFKLVVILILAAFFALFMIHPKSIFIWQNIPILKYFQFPWRFLIISGFLLSLAAGSISYMARKENTLKYVVIGIVFLLFIFYSSFFRPKDWLLITDEQKFSGDSWELQQTVSILDYLPIYAKKAPAERAPEEPVFEGEIIEGQKGTNWQKWKLKADKDTLVVLPVFYFPNWSVSVDDEGKEVNPSGDLGLVSFNMQEGEHEVYAKLEDTPLRTFSNLVSLGSLLAIPIYLRKKK